jgi:hypothetical protein
MGVAVDSAGNVFVADWDNSTIRKVTPAGVVTTLAGSAGSYGSADGTGSAARFYYPEGVAVDTNGNVFVADRDNHTIRKVDPDPLLMVPQRSPPQDARTQPSAQLIPKAKRGAGTAHEDIRPTRGRTVARPRVRSRNREIVAGDGRRGGFGLG